MDNLNILSFNIQQLPKILGCLPLTANSLERSKRLKKILKENYKDNGFDFIFLQERWIGSDDYKDLGYHLTPYNKGGLITLSRFPILGSQFYPYKEVGASPILEGTGFPFKYNKGVLVTKVEHPKGEIELVNTHLIASYPEVKKNYFHERREQLKELWKIVSKCHLPVIMAGDFNCGPKLDYESYHLMIEKYFSGFKKEDADSMKMSTYSTQNPRNKEDLGKVDHVFFSPNFHFFSSETIFKDIFTIKDKEDVLSDHYGVNVKLGIK